MIDLSLRLLRLLTFCGILWFSLSLYSQENSWNVTRYSSLNGLSTNDVSDMKQDDRGFIWLATSNGICRYDGYNFLNFYPQDCYGLHDNHIANLEFDKKNHFLWTISFTGNVSCFDLALGKFVDYLHEPKTRKTYHGHQLYSKGIILYDDDSGVRIISYEGGRFTKRDLTLGNGSLPDKHISAVEEDSNGDIWVMTDRGMVIVSSMGKSRIVGPRKKVLASQIVKGKCYVFYEDNFMGVFRGAKMEKKVIVPRIYGYQSKVSVHFLSGKKWYILGNRSSCVCDIQSLSFAKAEMQIPALRKPYQDNKYVVVSDNRGWAYIFEDGKFKLKKNLFESVSPDITFNYRIRVSKNIDNCLYMATAGNGMFVFDPNTHSISHMAITLDNSMMPSKILGVLFCDKDGSIWTSLEFAGLYKIYHPSIKTKIILPLPHATGDRANNIRVLHPIGFGKILVSTKDKKMFIFDEKDNSIKFFKEMPSNVYAYRMDHRGRVWIATRGSGFWIDGQHYDKRNFNLLKTNNIYDFIEDKYGRMWIATFGDGLLMATTLPNGKVVFSKYLSEAQGENDIRNLLIDANGWLWLATNKGIFVVDVKRKHIRKSHFINYSKQNDKFKDDEIICLFADAKSRIWIGSYGMGVAFTSLPKDYHRVKFNWITNQMGLLNNNVRSIIEDKKGNVWITSDEGINCLNKMNGYMDSYIDPNHFLSNIYSENSALVLGNGDLLFGTSQGLVRIRHHAYVKKTVATPQIVDLDINGESVFHSSNGLVKSLLAGEKIRLQPNENFITFYFSNLDFTHNTLYRTYMEGVDRDWERQSPNNSATYKNLPPGTYRFHVASMNGDNKWSQEKVLVVEVAPHWWGTWLFRFFGGGTLLVLTLGLGRILYNNFKLREKIRFERKFMEFRLNFFSQIAHEFRTPIAIIKSAMDKIKEAQTFYEAKDAIKAANRGSDRLLKLVNNLLMFRRVNTGNIRLNVTQNDIVCNMRQLYSDFRPMAEAKNIMLVFRAFEKKFVMLYDREKVETIVYNLLSNAIKYSMPKGVVELIIKYDVNQASLAIMVKDYGKGLTKEQEQSLFKPFMHGNISQGGMGVGLCMSYQLAQLHHATLAYHRPDDEQSGALFVLNLSTSLNTYTCDECNLGVTGEVKITEADPLIPQKQFREALNKQMVFVIEDDSDLLAQITQMLSVYFCVTGFSNGKEAFEQICKQKPALVVSDVMLPGMDGFCISKNIKANPETAMIKVILLTALDDEENRLKGIEAAADDYFVKPCSIRLLVARCFKLLEQYSVQKSSLTPSLEKKEEVKEHKLITSPVDKVFMDKVTSIVYAHLSETNFSVDQLSDLLGTGRTTTYNRIRDLFGMTPNEYIREERLQAAAKLLLEGDKNIAEISMSVGFSDPSYFNRRFKARFGVAPSKYGC